MDVRRGRRVESLVSTGCLQGRRTGRGREVKCLHFSSLTLNLAAVHHSLEPFKYLEQIERWVEHSLDDLFQELLENTVLINPGLVYPEVVDKLDSDDALHGVL